MVTPLIYLDLFNPKARSKDIPKQDRRLLIKWLKIKKQERQNKINLLDCNLNNFWDVCITCWNSNLQCYDDCFNKPQDGYIVDGAVMYDERMQKKCFEIGDS